MSNEKKKKRELCRKEKKIYMSSAGKERNIHGQVLLWNWSCVSKLKA